MRARTLRRGWCVIASVVLACSPAPSPPPSVTPPPVPADLVPWPDIVWVPAEGTASDDPGDGEQIVSVTAGAEGFVAVGFRESGPIRDGRIWYSEDGVEWLQAGPPATFDAVELVDVAAAPDGFVALGIGLLGPAVEHPHAVFFRSPDGQSWRRIGQVPGSEDTYPEWLTGGPDGLLAAGSDANGRPVVWHSPDGDQFERLEASAPGDGSIVDPQTIDGGYVALGSQSGPPLMLRSTDARTWSSSPIASDADMVAAHLVVSRWGYIAQGVWAPTCSGMASCPGENVGWWSGDGTGWARLPGDRSPISGGASIIVPAGDHGVVAIDGASAWESPDGWAWRPLPEPGDGSMSVSDAIVRGDVIVAVGAIFEEDRTSRAAIVVAE